MKNKLFICFKPLVIDSGEDHVDHSDHVSVVPSCLIVANGDQSKKQSSSTVKSSLWDSRNGKATGLRHKGVVKPQKALSPGLNAIFDFSMRTSVRDRNMYQLAMLSKSDCVKKRSKRLDLLDEKPLNPKAVEAKTGNSNTRKVVSPSSGSSSNQAKMRNCCIHRSRPCSSGHKKKQNTTPSGEKSIGSGPKSSSVLCLILFSLFCTMFLGRVCAVLLTLLWLYFIPHYWGLKSTGLMQEEASMEYNKKHHKEQ